MNDAPRYSADEFAREARYIENLIWDALVVEPGQRVLFCGYGSDGAWVRRAMDTGANVTVIEHRDEIIREFADLGATQLRGSTSVIPAKTDEFDLAISFHYLHETDPFFHAQIVSELARVSRRIALVEPAPPADPLGKRIALLYSQAKRELGQFEYYQPLEYWKKLVQSVKAEIQQHVFAFAKMPPQEYLRDTIDLILTTMRVEEIPQSYLEELRALARTSGAAMLPPARYVLVGSAVGDMSQPVFTPREEPTPTPAVAKATHPPSTRRPVTTEAGYEFPPVEPPPPLAPGFGVPPTPEPVQSVPTFGTPFASPPAPVEPAVPEPPPSAPFGAPFAMPGSPEGMPFGVPPAQSMPNAPGWHWEPPEGEDS
ncbi:MAG: hypothetical protein JO165_12690 [Candidatus Eremiobacteraeota bacterium]|nr:hypothetical protein [Candidatus Eremiobacteraeota bacterium]